MRLTVLLLVAAAIASAADSTAIENTGKPIAIPFHCDAQQLDDAGLSCTASDPCHVYLELTGIEVVGAKVFLTGNLHTRTTTVTSLVLETADHGATWTEPYERIPLASLEGIQFIDFERGWIAGESVQSVPRNPFLLMTDDGGKSWRKLMMFEDDQPGAVEGFWFDSRNSGTASIDTGLPGDRYELYATMTGGTDWMLRRKSRTPVAIRAGRAKDTTSDWRIHADRNSSTYQIERRAGEGWHSMTEFLIEAAVCRGE